MKVILSILDKIEETFIVICLIFMAGMNFVNVVSRYCFSNSFSFTEELTIIAFVWVSMIGIAAGYKRNAHLGMSYFVEKMPKNLQAIFTLISMCCSGIMIGVLLYYGAEMVASQLTMKAVTPALGLPQAIQGLSIPVAGIFILIRTLQSGLGEFKRIRKKETKKETNKDIIEGKG